MKRIICICLGIVLFVQTNFAANLYVDETFINTFKRPKYKTTYEVSNGVLYDNEQLRIEMNSNFYMRCNLAINKVKPNSRNLIVVMVNDVQIISYDNFEQKEQTFYAYVDPRLRGDFRVRFYSIDKTTKKPNTDVFVTLSNVETLSYIPNGV